MNDLTIIGTITIDRLHTLDKVKKLFGGIPWFAIELSQGTNIKLGIITNIGKDFPMGDISKPISEISTMNIVGKKTTTLDIFPDQKGVPAKIRNFTGAIHFSDLPIGKVAIISPLLQEISLKLIKKLRSKFTTIIIDIQGFTRLQFKPSMRLSDDTKTEPKELSQLCKIADIIKFSENEFEAVLQGLPFAEKLKTLHSWGLKNIIVTKSDKGCLISTINSQPKLLPVKPILTNNIVGAGDKFLILMGIFLAGNNTLENSVIKAQNKLQRILEVQI
jgi:hypothetical protein